jgi:hypothetical protein
MRSILCVVLPQPWVVAVRFAGKDLSLAGHALWQYLSGKDLLLAYRENPNWQIRKHHPQ